MSIYTVTRCNHNLLPFRAEVSIDEPQPLPNRFGDFFSKNHKLFQYIQDNPSPESTDLKKTYDLRAHISGLYGLSGVSPETLSTVISIADVLKTNVAINKEITRPQRFKIAKLCSFTIDSSQLIIHLKKKSNRRFLGEGHFSSFYVCLVITEDKINWCAEGTYKVSWTENNETKTRPIPRDPLKIVNTSKESLVLPHMAYEYQSRKTPMAHPIEKYCRIFPLHHADLVTTLNYFIFTSIDSSMTIWKILQQVIQRCNSLHKDNCVHRDIKLKNFLVDFPINEKGIDWKNPKVALGDTDTIIKQTAVHNTWKGTTKCWPPEAIRKKSKQSTSADVYALGVIISHCLDALQKVSTPPQEDIDFLNNLIAYAKDYNANPSAEELNKRLTEYLKKKASNNL